MTMVRASRASRGRCRAASTSPLTTLPRASRTASPTSSRSGPRNGRQHGDARRQQVEHRGRGDHHGIRVGERMECTAGAQAAEVGDRAAGGDDRVRGHQQVAVDDVRQGRGEAGQQEPVDREGGQDQDEERQPDVVVRDEDGDEDQQDGADEVADHEGHPPRPAVEEDADERAEDRERQQDRREAGGDGAGVRRALRGEEHRGDEGDLEDAVRELGQESHREQPAEPAVAQQGAQISEEGHPRRIGERRHADLGVCGTA